MSRSILFFILSTLLSIGTFYFKKENSYDLHLVVPVGLYFIIALLLSFEPKVELNKKLSFVWLALLTWIILFLLSYSALFVIVAPISGGVGAWVVLWLCKKYLGLTVEKQWPVVLTGVVTALLGIGFMVLVKKHATLGLKAGVLTGLWQLGIGLLFTKQLKEETQGVQPV